MGVQIYWKWNHKFPDLEENDVQGVLKKFLIMKLVDFEHKNVTICSF